MSIANRSSTPSRCLLPGSHRNQMVSTSEYLSMSSSNGYLAYVFRDGTRGRQTFSFTTFPRTWKILWVFFPEWSCLLHMTTLHNLRIVERVKAKDSFHFLWRMKNKSLRFKELRGQPNLEVNRDVCLCGDKYGNGQVQSSQRSGISVVQLAMRLIEYSGGKCNFLFS